MFGQNGFRDNSSHSSGLDQLEYRRDEMDNKNNQIAHEEWYSSPQTTKFRANLEFAIDRSQRVNNLLLNFFRMSSIRPE